MDDFTVQIDADGGRWAETEILGNQAIVKVRASATTLAAIAVAPGIRRISLGRLNDPVSSLSIAQRTALRQEILDAGYAEAELIARHPDFVVLTLGDVLRFLAQRRLKPRYDAAGDAIVLDGPVQPVRPIASVDAEVA